MSSHQLQQQMIINKRKQLNTKLKMKSTIIDILTWVLWIYMGLYIYNRVDNLLEQPILEHFHLTEILKYSGIIVVCMLVIAIIWSFFTKLTTKYSTKVK